MTRKLFLATAAACAFVAGPALADYTISILHTNDFHSRVEPINKYDSSCGEKDNAEGKCFGGYARMVNAIKAAREASPNSLLVDGGDQFQGSLFYTYYKGKVAAEMMNLLGYDAMTVGNHEFDDGPGVLRGFMDAVKFPVLLANADISKEPTLADVLKASTIIEKDGQKIGLIGVTPADTSELASPGPNIRFGDPVPAVQAEVDKLKAAGVNKIVLLSHSGYSVDLWIASRVSGLDVIVGGHSNTYLSNVSDRADGPYPTWRNGPDGGKVAVVQAYAFGKYLGKLDVTFDDDGNVTAAVGEPIVVDGKIAEDSTLKTRIAELAQPLDEIRNKVIGQSSAPIDGDRKACRAVVCEMGVLVADAMLDSVKDKGFTIAFANGGGLRSSIDEGEVTMGEVLTVLPFQNTLATFQIKGKDIVAALETGVSEVEEGKGKFPQVAGLKFTWTRSVQPKQGRVKEVLVMKDGAWVPIDPEATYGVVTNNYVRTGGDGYVMFAENAIDPYDFGPDLADVVAAYIAAAGSYKPYTDDRIVEQ
ncbi:MAG: bifunctional metallophosphatase/5'-nucleotidase [Rhodospirillales bacterium]